MTETILDFIWEILKGISVRLPQHSLCYTGNPAHPCSCHTHAYMPADCVMCGNHCPETMYATFRNRLIRLSPTGMMALNNLVFHDTISQAGSQIHTLVNFAGKTQVLLSGHAVTNGGKIPQTHCRAGLHCTANSHTLPLSMSGVGAVEHAVFTRSESLSRQQQCCYMPLWPWVLSAGTGEKL